MDELKSERPPGDLPIDLPAVVKAFNNCRRSDGTLATDHLSTNELVRYIRLLFEKNDIMHYLVKKKNIKERIITLVPR